MWQRGILRKSRPAAGIAIRRLSETDCREYINLRRQAVTEAPDAFVVSLAEVDRDPPETVRAFVRDNVVLGAWRGEKLVGTAALCFLPTRLRHMCELARMYVSPTVRGQGVGDALLEAFTRNMDELGLEACKLSVVAKNKPAVRLYRRHGFRVYGRLKNEFHASYGKVIGLHMVKWRKPGNG